MSDPSTELLKVLAKMRTQALQPIPHKVEDVDRAIELAKQVDRLLNPTPQPIITAADLHELKPGRKVKDSAGDIWQKQHSGMWEMLYYRGEDGDVLQLSAEHLVHVWSPLHALPEEN